MIISENDIKVLSECDCHIIDIIEINQYVVVLIKAPNNEYHLGFSRDGASFMDRVQQQSSHINLAGLSTIMQRIKRWVDIYGEIIISSNSPEKMQKYHKILTRSGFSATDMTPQFNHTRKFCGIFAINWGKNERIY